jgi:hypothetical protein
MNEIKIAVNLYVFTLAVVVWVVLLGLTAIPGYDMPEPLAFLFATLTGVILTIVQGFKEGVTFTSTTSTDTMTHTETSTKGATTDEKTDPATPSDTLPPVV